MATKKHFGKLPPRYSFILNPHAETRLSRCPQCDKLTYPRKFALFIYVDQWGPFVLGKTAKYCSGCELIMVHQDELEDEMARYFDRLAPQVVGNEYLVVGTVDKKVWQAGLQGAQTTIVQILQSTADFKEVMGLNFRPRGWYFDGDPEQK